MFLALLYDAAARASLIDEGFSSIPKTNPAFFDTQSAMLPAPQ
jgi:hypothetical protein